MHFGGTAEENRECATISILKIPPLMCPNPNSLYNGQAWILKNESHSELHGIRGTSINLPRERSGGRWGRENSSDPGLAVWHSDCWAAMDSCRQGSKENGAKHRALGKQRDDLSEHEWSQNSYRWHFFSEKGFEQILKSVNNIRIMARGRHN